MSAPPPPPTSRIAPGTRLGRFLIRGLLGRGGMGAVYVAEEVDGPTAGRRVALKVLAPERAGPDGRSRFERERSLLAQVSHENVVPCLGPLEEDPATGRVSFPMQLVIGRSVTDLLQEHGPFPLGEAVRILAETAAGLEAAHATGLVHRDVKPSNILLDRDRSVRLTDFGLARALDETRLTVSGATLGTPAYMSPEQAEGREAGVAADLYALGVVAYEVLTGRLPFHADNALALLRLHVDARPRPPTELRASIPPPLERLVLSLLEKDPAKRPASAAAVKAELEAMAGAVGAGDDAFVARVGESIDRETRALAALPQATTAATPVPTKRSRSGWLVITAMAVVLTAMAAASTFRPGAPAIAPAPPPPPAPAKARGVVRLRDGRTFAGTVTEIGDDELVLLGPDAVLRKFPRRDLVQLDYEEPR